MPLAKSISLSGALVLAVAGLATPAAGALGAPPTSIARYEVSHEGRRELLDVVRTSERIEYRYLSRGISEVWRRDAGGEFEHWKVFHRASRSVHYTMGDLRTVGAEPSWEQLATMVDPQERSSLVPSGTRRTAHGLATVLERKARGECVRVLWIEDAGWAAEVSRGTGEHRKSYRLLSSDACTPSRCADTLATGNMQEVEFADLGDKEGDPFVRQFLAVFSAHTHH